MKNSSTKIVTSFSYTNFTWNLTKMSSLLMFLNAIYAESFITYNLIIFILMSNLIFFLTGRIVSRKNCLFQKCQLTCHCHRSICELKVTDFLPLNELSTWQAEDLHVTHFGDSPSADSTFFALLISCLVPLSIMPIASFTCSYCTNCN